MNKKIVSAAALLMSGVMVFSGCETKKESGETNDYDKTVVATVNGEEAKLSDFNFVYYTNAAQFEQYYTMYMGIEDWENETLEGEDQTCGEYVRENAVKELQQLMVAQQKAKEYGIKADKKLAEEVTSQKDGVIENNFGGDEGYKEYLDSYYTSDAAIERYLTRASIINDLLEKMSEKGGECEVKDEELEYNDDKYLKVKHVLVSTQADEEGNTLTDEEALAKANEVIAKLDAGEDMDKLIEEYNDDPGMEQQDYYVFGEGEMVDEFYQASKALEKGAWSKEPVKSSYGYHVIYRYELDKKDDKFAELKQTKAQEKFMELLEKWADEAEVTVKDKDIDKALEAQKADKKAKQEAAKAEAEAAAKEQAENGDNADTDADSNADADSSADADAAADGNADAPETTPAE